MKEIGDTYWNTPNEGATNISGFSGLPSGTHGGAGEFYGFGVNAFYWVNTTDNGSEWYSGLHYSQKNTGVYEQTDMLWSYHSIRLVKD